MKKMPICEQIMCRNIIELIKEYLSDPKNLEELNRFEQEKEKENEKVAQKGSLKQQ